MEKAHFSKALWVILILLTLALCFEFAQGRGKKRCEAQKKALQVHKKPELKRFSWVHTRGQKKIGGMGKPRGPEEMLELEQKGVGLLVTLTQEALPGHYFKDTSIKSLHLPIANSGVPTFEQVEKFLRASQDIHQEKKAVVVHCQAGIGRTGTLLATWMIANEPSMTSSGMTAKKVIEQLRARRNPSVSSTAQENFIAAFFKRIKKGPR